MAPTSRLPGFHELTPEERLKEVARSAGLSREDVEALRGGLPTAEAATMAENVVGTFGVPLGIATNFIVNGRDVLVPLATEEASVVAAASHAAKMARGNGGFTATAPESVAVGQVQLLEVKDRRALESTVRANEAKLIAVLNDPASGIVQRGGGAKRLEVRHLETAAGPMSVVEVVADVRDAMGANAVNTMCEALAPLLADLTGARPLLRILTNLADRRIAKARAVFDGKALGGPRVSRGIVEAWAFADADAYRAVTHNKGILNGVAALALATGNDTRAVEAAAHAYAARSGRYRSLSTFRALPGGDVEGALEMPMPLGTVGGVTAVHPAAKAALKVLGVSGAGELAAIAASVGLAQNLAALRALADEGIQEGHMRLHARNVAVMAGASGKRADEVAERLIAEGNVRVSRAKEMLDERGEPA